MNTTVWQNLAAPFPVSDIEWRVQSSGFNKEGKPWAKVLAYITNRAIQQRLDDVLDPGNWKNEFTTGPGGGIMCGLSIRVDDEWVTKWDGAENTDVEAIKGGLSSAMKRAAVQWGIGRYLYDLEEDWAVFSDRGQFRAKVKKDKNDTGTSFRWDPPKLPDWALPAPDIATDKQVQSLHDFAAMVWEDKRIPSKITGYLAKHKAGRLTVVEAQKVIDGLTDIKNKGAAS